MVVVATNDWWSQISHHWMVGTFTGHPIFGFEKNGIRLRSFQLKKSIGDTFGTMALSLIPCAGDFDIFRPMDSFFEATKQCIETGHRRLNCLSWLCSLHSIWLAVSTIVLISTKLGINSSWILIMRVAHLHSVVAG